MPSPSGNINEEIFNVVKTAAASSSNSGYKPIRGEYTNEETEAFIRKSIYEKLTDGSRKFIPEEVLKEARSDSNKKKTKLGLKQFLVAIAVIVIIGSVFFLVSPFLVVIISLLTGVVLIIFGYKNFSKHLLIANTPISKIEAAPIGLNFFNIRFSPAADKPLIAPLSKKECVAYGIAIYIPDDTVNSNSTYNNYEYRSIEYEPSRRSFTRGISSLLDDGTGYLSLVPLDITNGTTPKIDYAVSYYFSDKHSFYFSNKIINDTSTNVANNIDIINNTNNNINKKTGIINKIENAINYERHIFSVNLIEKKFDEARANGTDPDLSEFEFYPVENVVKSVASQPLKEPQIGCYLGEYCVPTNTQYTAIGNILHTTNELNGKPIHVLERDNDSGLFAIRAGSEKRVESSYYATSLTLFAIGAIFLLASIGFGSYNNNYACLVIVNQSGHYTCGYYIFGNTSLSTTKLKNTTSAPASAPAPTPSTPSAPQTSYNSNRTTDCGNFYVKDRNFADVKYYNCSWSGGNITINLQGGDSGYVYVRITSLSNGTRYYAKGTTVRCLTQISNIYLPQGEYNVFINTGGGGGGCGAAIVEMNAT